MGIRTRHDISGAIDENTPEHIFNHPILGKHLKAVDEDAKPYVAVLHRPADHGDEVNTASSDEPDVKLPELKRASSDTNKKNGKD